MHAVNVFQHLRRSPGRAPNTRLWGGALTIALILASGCREAKPPSSASPISPKEAQANIVSGNFRDLARTPGDCFSIPIPYGITGQMVSTGFAGTDLSRWANLWNSRYAILATRGQKNGVPIQPLSPQGQSLYTDAWARFMAAHH